MALIIKKKGKTTHKSTGGTVANPKAHNTPLKKKPGAIASYLKKGKKAQHLLDEEHSKEVVREAKRGKLRRFYLPAKAESTITFIDGDLDSDGMLDAVMFMEHNVKIGNDYRNWFVCIAEDEPCPLCTDNVSSPYLGGALTIVDHDEFEYNGKVYRNQKRLYVFKKRTLELLVEYAREYGGLAGCTFHIKRTSADVANVGDVLLFKKKRTLAELAKAYPAEGLWEVADYEKEIPYHSSEDLREMGYGSIPVGAEATMEEQAEEGSTVVDDEL